MPHDASAAAAQTTEDPARREEALRQALSAWLPVLPAAPGAQLRIVGSEVAVQQAFGPWTRLPLSECPATAADLAHFVPKAAAWWPANLALAADVGAQQVGSGWLLRRRHGGGGPAGDALDLAAARGLCTVGELRALRATLAAGGNVLLVGPQVLCTPLALALCAEGECPAVVAGDAGPLVGNPFVQVPDVAAAQHLGCDRLALLGWPVKATVAGLQQAAGAVACLEGRGIGRGLMRFEAAARGRDASLAVLASIDVVVDVGFGAAGMASAAASAATDSAAPAQQATAGAVLREVADIVLTDAGYRPRSWPRGAADPDAAAEATEVTQVDEANATSAQAEAWAAWTDDLDGSAADALRAVAGQVAARPVLPPPPSAARRKALVRERRATATTAPLVQPLTRAADASPQPGWELDQLGPAASLASAATDEAQAAADAHQGPGEATLHAHAAMAASFGLGPPSRPSVAAPALDQPAASGFVGDVDRGSGDEP